jgi:hypothetical protein
VAREVPEGDIPVEGMISIPDRRRAVPRAAAMIFACAAAVAAPGGAFGQQERFLPPSVVNAQLDSLERVALTSSSPDERRAAITRISAPGWMRSDQVEGRPAVRYPGIVARLARIYRQSDDYWTRYSIIRLLIPQVERADAVAFLEEVAQEPGAEPATPPDVALIEDKWSLQALAIGALTRVGPDGEASLRRLHGAGTVRERTARAELEHLASRGFRTSTEDSGLDPWLGRSWEDLAVKGCN